VEVNGNAVVISHAGSIRKASLPLDEAEMKLPVPAAASIKARGVDPAGYIWCGAPVRVGAREMIISAMKDRTEQVMADFRGRNAASFLRLSTEGREVRPDGWMKQSVSVGNRTIETIWINAAGEELRTTQENH
jgi:hypothetical protein